VGGNSTGLRAHQSPTTSAAVKVGRHVLCDMFGAGNIDSPAFADAAIRRAVDAAGATMLNVFLHEFEPAGVSALAALAESHLALHTWPEHDLITVDAFTCGDADPQKAIDELVRLYAPQRCEMRSLARAVDRRDFVESEPGSPISSVYGDSRRLYDGHSEHQRIAVFERAGIGRVLALEDIVQVTELDSFVYHEMLAHPALAAHPKPERVAVIGGGDGLIVREILRHPSVTAVDVFELDGQVVEVSRRFFGTWEPDPRVRIEIGDAFGALEPGTYDVILADIPDPLGQAARLFGPEFFSQAQGALRPAGGVLAVQCESLHFHPDVVRRCVAALRRGFAQVGVVQGAMATYPGAWWTFAVASTLGTHPSVAQSGHDLAGTRLYRPEAHAWYFIPDVVLEGLLG
jgi:spermidine synthase